MVSVNVLVVRRHEIKEEIIRLEARLADLRKELNELDMVDQIIARYVGDTGAIARSPDEPSEEGSSGGKPEGSPTVPEMITEALQAARAAGRRGLAPKEMAGYVRTKWWPSAKTENISSIAWRMWRRGELVKKDGVYSLPEKAEAADGAS